MSIVKFTRSTSRVIDQSVWRGWGSHILVMTLSGHGDYRIAFEFPAVKTSKQDKSSCVTVFVQDQRRTDAFVLSRSGSVKDNVPVEGKFLNAGFYLIKRN